MARIAAEAFWLRTYQAALSGMTVDAIGLDFFRVSMNALKDARLIRLIRALEDDSQTASFWYLLKANAPLVKKAAKAGGLNLTKLKQAADALKDIRNKTFVHIDKDGVFDPQQYYQKAGLKHADLAALIESLWQTMRWLYKHDFGEDVPHDEYDGKDIKKLADLRDAYA